MFRIDAHLHYIGDHPDAIALVDELDLQLLNICVAHEADDEVWRNREARHYESLTKKRPDRFAWCTSFDPFGHAERGYVDRVIEKLERDFAAGAIACKVWKNVGMEIKKAGSEFIMVDDPAYEPIFRHLEQTGRPLLMHIGEPHACWQPLKPGNPHYNYYKNYPQWHMYNRPDFPHHEQLIAARDNVVARHPDLHCIGAHMGSLEYDVAEVAKRLDRFPNFAVDTSARFLDLAVQDRSKVRDFFSQYKDRLLFGTDIVVRRPINPLSPQERAEVLAPVKQRWLTEFAFYESDDDVEYPGFNIHGLALSADVLQAYYVDNARRWYPALATAHARA